MPVSATPMMTMAMSQQTLTPPATDVVFGPPTPDTIPIQDNQLARHLQEAEAPEDLDHFLQSEHGRRWYDNWRSGQVDDDMVMARWGKPVLELFAITGTIEDDPHALDTQKADRTDGVAEKGDGEASSLASCVGYVAPEAAADETARDETGDEEQDVMEEGDVNQQGDDVVLMQQPPARSFEEMIQKLLKAMDGMLKPKAERLSGFLRQLMKDQRRHSPHLRNPKLVERYERLSALIALFEGNAPELRGDEMEWCLATWQDLVPFLEDAQKLDGQNATTPPRPSNSTAEAIVVIDSQEQAIEDGSKKQVAVLEDGSQRDLTEAERQQLLENELMEEIAAEAMREEEQAMWNDFHAAEWRTWEEWAVSQDDLAQGRSKRARVQILVQGEGGRIIRQESWLFGLREGERLAYNVQILQNEDIHDEHDPTAASSGEAGGEAVPLRDFGHEDPVSQAVHGAEGGMSTGGGEASTLPVTGELAPDMWNADDHSVDNDISVEDFMVTELADKFYRLWMAGKVTDRLVGSRFGYGVLGRFYGMRDLERQEAEDAAETVGVVGGSKPMEPTMHGVDEGGAGGAVDSPGLVAGGMSGTACGDAEGQGLAAGAVASTADGSGVAASLTSPTAGSSGAGATEGSEPSSTSTLTGSRQTSLSHWLL